MQSPCPAHLRAAQDTSVTAVGTVSANVRLRHPLAALGESREGQAQCREHAQAQQVELDQTCARAIVLIPLQNCAPFHGGPSHRADLSDGAVGQNHAAGVDAEMTRQLQQALGNVDDRLRRPLGHGMGRAVGRRGARAIGANAPPAIHLAGPCVLQAGRMTEGPGGVTNRGAGTIGDDIGDLGGALAAIAGVDVLDDFLSTAGLDVEVNIGVAGSIRG